MNMDATPDIAAARRWADFYRSRGWNPLPSRPDAKRPLVRFAQWWDESAPADLFDRHPTPSLQLMTGRRWRLLAIDLDGPEASDWFRSRGPIPRTWATHSGGDGLHLWFRVPADLPETPRAILWKGEGRHAAVERLCDRSLIMVPPSIHPTTGRRYRFASPGASPKRLPTPAECPGWVLRLAPVGPARVPGATPPARSPRKVAATGRYRAAEVLAAIPDKAAVARSWGVRIAASRPNAAGWYSCHAIGREDRTPSASLSAETGRYWEPGIRPISLFDLGARLGVYADWRDAVNDLGVRYAWAP